VREKWWSKTASSAARGIIGTGSSVMASWKADPRQGLRTYPIALDGDDVVITV
jgi:hypothetical protein